MRLAVRSAGALLLLGSLGFLMRAIMRVDLDGLGSALDGRTVALLALLAAGYGLALVALAFAWWLILIGREARHGFTGAFSAYGLSVFAKYLPGSVFQYASRQALAARHGWPQAVIAKASLAEIVMHLAASLAVFLAADRLFGLNRAGGLPAIIIVGSVTVGIAWLIVRAPAEAGRLLAAIAAQLLFFSLLMLIAAGCASALGAPPQSAIEAGNLFLLAWLVGFVAPGVPGGIGVREAGIVATVSAVLGPDGALLFATATRIVTLAGDGLFALGALLADRTLEQAGLRQD